VGGSLAVVGPLAAVAVALDHLTRPARESRAAAEDLVKSLEAAAKSQVPEFQRLADQIAEVGLRSDETRERIRGLQAQQALLENQFGGIAGKLIFNLTDDLFQTGLDKEKALFEQLKAQRKNLAATPVTVGKDLLRDLANEAATAGLTEAEARKLSIT